MRPEELDTTRNLIPAWCATCLACIPCLAAKVERDRQELESTAPQLCVPNFSLNVQAWETIFRVDSSNANLAGVQCDTAGLSEAFGRCRCCYTSQAQRLDNRQLDLLGRKCA
jgi:hypothetical protein